MLNLPQDANELRNAIKDAIEFYQGSPAKNNNKLNEALAASLGFENYDQLAPLLKEPETIKTYDIEFDYDLPQCLVIGGIRIDEELVHDEVIAYTISDREDRISDLRQWIGEAQSDSRRQNDVLLMQEDLDTLLASNETYVLEAYATNGFIAADLEPELFNKTCHEMLMDAAKHCGNEAIQDFIEDINLSALELKSKYLNRHSDASLDEIEYPYFELTVDEWQLEVSEGNTQRSYWIWVQAKLEELSFDGIDIKEQD